MLGAMRWRDLALICLLVAAFACGDGRLPAFARPPMTDADGGLLEAAD